VRRWHAPTGHFGGRTQIEAARKPRLGVCSAITRKAEKSMRKVEMPTLSIMVVTKTVFWSTSRSSHLIPNST
jgi:hypothetical protein